MPNSDDKPVGIIMPSNENIRFIDGMRGLAALYVMIGHARWLLWEGYSSGYQLHPENYSMIGKLLVYTLSFFKFGHEVVLFFFVLSGFVIHLKYAKALSADPSFPFDWGNYFIRRIKRIYPPFLFTIVLTYILDVTGMHFNFSIYNGATPNALINSNISTDHSFQNLVGNLFFIRHGNIDIWGTNGPLWSLKYEWWFYVLFPFLYLLNRKSVLLGIAGVVGLFVVGSVVQVGGNDFFLTVFKSLSCWYLGVILADIYTGRLKLSHQYMSLFILLFPVAVLSGRWNIEGIYTDFLWAVCFFGLLNLILFLNTRYSAGIKLSAIKWLGDCSYTLYIIHFPIFVLFNGILLRSRNNVMPQSFIPFFIGVIFAVSLAYVLHFVIEKPFISTYKLKRLDIAK